LHRQPHNEIKITPAATFILTADSSTQHHGSRADLLRHQKLSDILLGGESEKPTRKVSICMSAE
jgi:hypothetical protein